MQPIRKNMLNLAYATVIIIVAFLVIRFIYYEKRSDEPVAIKINEYTITAREFDELFTQSGIYEDTPEARKSFMKNLITRKLLLQEGQKEGMDRQREFLKSIESFWEQALLNIVLDRKTRELSRRISITDAELEDFYIDWSKKHPDNKETLEQLSELIRWQLLHKKQRVAIDAWIDRLRNEAEIEIDNNAVGIE